MVRSSDVIFPFNNFNNHYNPFGFVYIDVWRMKTVQNGLSFEIVVA